MDDSATRFGGFSRLYGTDAAERITRAHACVVGIGGVGSWTVEALARSGIGQMTLVDLDDVCLSNVNRQIHALGSTVGRFKVEVMADRAMEIHPGIRVHPLRKYLTEDNAVELLGEPGFDVVVDAIDNGRLKCALLDACRMLEVAAVTVGGAGGLRDPARVRRADLAKSHSDPLLHQVRKRLRQRHGWPRGEQNFGVACVYSEEQPVVHECGEDVAGKPAGKAINCNTGLGTSAAVTGAFGLAAAAAVLDLLADPGAVRSVSGRGGRHGDA